MTIWASRLEADFCFKGKGFTKEIVWGLLGVEPERYFKEGDGYTVKGHKRKRKFDYALLRKDYQVTENNISPPLEELSQDLATRQKALVSFVGHYCSDAWVALRIKVIRDYQYDFRLESSAMSTIASIFKYITMSIQEVEE